MLHTLTARPIAQENQDGGEEKGQDEGRKAEGEGEEGSGEEEGAKSIWDYIKKNKLQDAKNRRMINADANLKAVFGGRGQVSMFEMTKLVSKHLS